MGMSVEKHGRREVWCARGRVAFFARGVEKCPPVPGGAPPLSTLPFLLLLLLPYHGHQLLQVARLQHGLHAGAARVGRVHVRGRRVGAAAAAAARELCCVFFLCVCVERGERVRADESATPRPTGIVGVSKQGVEVRGAGGMVARRRAHAGRWPPASQCAPAAPCPSAPRLAGRPRPWRCGICRCACPLAMARRVCQPR